METNLIERLALTLATEEAVLLVKKLSPVRFLRNSGIEVYLVPMSEPFMLPSGQAVPGSYLKVRAETDFRCGMGVGYVVAVSEGSI